MEKQTKTTKSVGKRHTVTVVLVLVAFFIGLSLLLYPTIANYINSLDYRKAIEEYDKEVETLNDAERKEMLEAAKLWNAELLQNAGRMKELSEEQRAYYNSLLDPSGTGIMGYIEIEKVNIYLPIYHGTEENVLHGGIGHLEGSSLPVGGKGVHTLLSGHSGLPSAKLFTNIDQLEVGDTFTVHVLGELLTYQVESTVTVLPEEAEKLCIEPEQDVCTLMTCTPYGVNTHRLLVRGVRIETPRSDQPDNSESAKDQPDAEPHVPWIVIAVAGIVLTVFVFLVVRFVRRRKMSGTGGGNNI